MTAPDTHTDQPQPVEPSLVELRSVRALLKTCAPGWTWRFTRAVGPLDVTALSEHTDGDGHRTRITRTETVESIVGTGHHPGPPHRVVVALWIRRPGKSWTLDTAWRGRGQGENTPAQLTATELTAYVAPPPADDLTLDLDVRSAA